MSLISIERNRIAHILAAGLAGLFLLGLSGCQGDDGPPGPAGPTGATGPAGPPGPGVGPETIDLSDADSVSALVAAKDVIEAEITGVTIASPPVVQFSLSSSAGTPLVGVSAGSLSFTLAKLVPAAGGVPAYWQSYINRLEEADEAPGIPQELEKALQAYRESGRDGELVDNGDGTYQYTYATDPANVTTPVAIAYDPSLTHRVGFELRVNGAINPDNPTFDVVPAGGAPTSRAIVTTKTCNDCHKRLALHGSGRFEADYCSTCHNPGTRDQNTGALVDLGHMAHAMHGADFRTEQGIADSCTAQGGTLVTISRQLKCLIDPADEATEVPVNPKFYEYVVYGHNDGENAYGDLRYPQDVLSCETCHDASKSAEGGQWNENYRAETCGGCHVSILVVGEPDADTGLSEYGIDHGFTVAMNGSCTTCHGNPAVGAPTPLQAHSNIAGSTRLRLALGEQFKFEILDADLTVDPPTVTFQITNPADGSFYDIINGPAFNGSAASLNLYMAWSTDDIYNGDENGLSLGARSDGNSVQGGTLDPSYPFRMLLSDIKANAAANADGSYTVNYFTSLPANISGDVMISLGGHPNVNGERAYAESAVFFPGAERPAVVDNDKCNACHGKLAFHGGNRVLGDYRICLNCHNADLAHESHVEVDPGDPPHEIADFFDSVSLGVMVHNIHIGSPTYFAGEFAEVRLPIAAQTDLCEICHVPGSYTGPRETARMISIYQDDPLVWSDDAVDSPTAGICTNCHTSLQAENHMVLNGGLLGEVAVDEINGNTVLTPVKENFTATGAVPGVPVFSNEACSVCHAAGKVADVIEAHKGVLPPDTGGH